MDECLSWFYAVWWPASISPICALFHFISQTIYSLAQILVCLSLLFDSFSHEYWLFLNCLFIIEMVMNNLIAINTFLMNLAFDHWCWWFIYASFNMRLFVHKHLLIYSFWIWDQSITKIVDVSDKLINADIIFDSVNILIVNTDK